MTSITLTAKESALAQATRVYDYDSASVKEKALHGDLYRLRCLDDDALMQSIRRAVLAQESRIILNKNKSDILAELIGFLSSTKTNQPTTDDGAINRVLFSHFARDNTSQIDSTAQNV